ncbi:DUF2326 domain-containing protein [bacterium]|nr:DUF2326 domain-containing protein [bacterium]
MKINSLYSNKPKIFPRIDFNKGLNVIFARVKDPLNKELDSHNLGKTFLIQIIDFALIGKPPKAFHDNSALFDDFIFFIEIESDYGQLFTVSRAVKGKNVINIHLHDKEYLDLTSLPSENWRFPNLSQDAGKNEINKLLNLTVIEPYNFRKGLGYFLRGQSDWDDEFRISKFGRGKDIDWKPYMALVLGFNHNIVHRKYEIDAKISGHKDYQKKLEAEAGLKAEEYDHIRGQIEITQDQSDRLRLEIENFSFQEIESEINEETVIKIEEQVASLNQERYTLDFELNEIQKSLESEFSFNIDEIDNIFKEVKVTLPNQLVRDYEDLLNFNKRISLDRRDRLYQLQEKLSAKRIAIENELARLDRERQTALNVLKEKETLKKYVDYNRRLLRYEEEINDLRQQLSHLDLVTSIQKEIDALEKERIQLIEQIKEMIRNDDSTHSKIRLAFSNCVEEILSIQALLSVRVNKEGNLEFNTSTIDRDIEGRITSESEGTSYKKLLCACFDLSVLGFYHDKPFYHFVYHDGIFEGLDNRKKEGLLKVIRKYIYAYNLQYILTVIDSDLPRNERDQKLFFNQDEIIRELHDQGDDGRLFRMKAF